MTRRIRPVLFLAAALLAAALTAPALAAVYRNKATGETLQGTLTAQRINNRNVFKTDDGRTKYVNPDEWELVDANPAATAPAPAAPAPAAPPAPAPPPAVQPATPAPPSTPEKTETATSVYVFPIQGPVESYAQVEALERGLAEAKKQKAGIVILRIEATGGKTRLVEQINKVLGKVEGTTLVALLKTTDSSPSSFGVNLGLNAQKTFIAPGCRVGAVSVTRRIGPMTRVPADERTQSTFLAQFRSLAQVRGLPPLIVEALTDRTAIVVQVFLDGKPMLVNEQEAQKMNFEHQSDGRFKRGKMLCQPGQPLNLTSEEAVEFGICTAVATDEKDLLAKMGKANCRIFEAKWAPSWVTKTAEERKKLVADCKAAFDQGRSDATSALLSRQLVPPSTAQYKVLSNQALTSLKDCAKALTEMEKFAKDERYTVTYSQDDLSEWRADIERMYRAAAAQ